MKNLKLKSILISSVMAAAIATFPLSSFAQISVGGGVEGSVVANPSLTPNISGISAPVMLHTGEQGTWTIKASDPQNGTLSYEVNWGDSQVGPLSMFSTPIFVQTSTFTHTYVNPGEYKVTFTVKNDAGLSTTSTVTVHVVGQSVGQAPVITNLMANSNRPHSAIIRWTTDVRSDSSVWFSKTTPVSTSGSANVMLHAKVLHHQVALFGLDPNTKYYVVVGSADSAGMTKSSEISFTTPALANAPTITSLSGPTTVAAGQTETVTVNATDPQNGTLSYTVNWGDTATMGMMSIPPFTQTSTFTHVYSTPGTYTATFTVENAAGLKASSSLNIVVTAAVADTTPPVIAPHDNITVDATSSAGAVVNYTPPQVTDNVDATTTATCTPAPGSTFPMGDTTVLCDHTDLAGNHAVETSFIVSVITNNIPMITNVHTSSVTSSSAVVTWTTDENSNSEVFYSKTTPVDVTSSSTPSVSSDTQVMAHSITLTGLTPNTLYHFIVQSSDTSGNVASSTEATFTTQP